MKPKFFKVLIFTISFINLFTNNLFTKNQKIFEGTITLLRDYSDEEYCITHLQKFLKDEYGDSIFYIPTHDERCYHIDCSKCNLGWVEEFILEDDDYNDYIEKYWSCDCVRGNSFVWRPTWSRCQYNSIYKGYFEGDFRKYRNHFFNHISYIKNNKDCSCYWPELNPLATEINNNSIVLFYNLFKKTPLKVLYEEDTEQQDFMGVKTYSHWGYSGLSIYIASNSFFYSDYEKKLIDIENYSKNHFNKEDYNLINSQIEYIRDSLIPQYYLLYLTCQWSHPHEYVNFEKTYLDYLWGSLEDEDNLYKRSYEPIIYSNVADGKNIQPFYTSSDFDIYEFEQSKNKIKTKKVILETQHRSYEYDDETKNIEKSIDESKIRLSELYLARGSVLNEALLYNEAIQILTESIKIYPNNTFSYIERALAYFETGQVDLAIIDIEKYHSISTRKYSSLSFHENKSHLKSYFEYSTGFIQGSMIGMKDSVVDIIPSTLSSLKGISQGIWSFVCSPIDVSNELIQTSYDLVEYIKLHTTSEMLMDMAPEVKNLLLQWDKINDKDKGYQLGYIVGKYGIEIFGGGGSVKLVKKYRDFKRANIVLTMDTCAKSKSNKIRILQEATLKESQRKDFFKSCNVKIHWDSQNKHIPGKHNYIAGKSIFEHKDPQKLIDQFAGKGRRANNVKPGNPGYLEIVDFKEHIGIWLEKDGKLSLPTTKGKIHYSKKGAHIVPYYPHGEL